MKLNKFELEGKLIDVHTHSVGLALNQLLNGRYPYAQDIFDLSDTIRRNNIDYAVSFPMPNSVYYNTINVSEKNFNLKYRPSGNCEYPYQIENIYLAKIIDEMNLDNILPFLSISANDKILEQVHNISALIEQYPIYGLKYHASIERKSINSVEFAYFAEVAEKYNIPIMVHTELREDAHPDNLISFSIQHPNIRICAAHAAFFHKPFFELLKKGEFPNVFVDCAPLMRLCHDMMENSGQNRLDLNFINPEYVLLALIQMIPNHILWGSDMPYYRYKTKYGISSYEQEALIINNCSYKNLITNNTIRYLLGK